MAPAGCPGRKGADQGASSRESACVRVRPPVAPQPLPKLWRPAELRLERRAPLPNQVVADVGRPRRRALALRDRLPALITAEEVHPRVHAARVALQGALDQAYLLEEAAPVELRAEPLCSSQGRF